ncbi:hypothetical protein [uncultured Dialister sp.]|uniref:hypothetical protein n=1 Tax=uncultured Dialister sp. TaxID=278064 RepID=UPI00258F59BB|nr:hypothetical protein [uncultured Dialister sp.]
MTETKGTAVTDLLPMIRQWDQQYYYRSIEADKSNFGLISMYGHYEDWQPVSVVYPDTESHFVKHGKHH